MRNILNDRISIISNMLSNSGFRYDDEDNLWYDENHNREKYYYRIGISNDWMRFKLFCGGYDNNISSFETIEECLNMIKL